MEKVDQKNEDMLMHFVSWTKIYWLVVLLLPAIIWVMTGIMYNAIWIGWNWTIVIYAICLILYIIVLYRFKKEYQALDVGSNGKTSRT